MKFVAMSVMKKKQTAAVRPVRAPKVATQSRAVSSEAELPDGGVAALITEPVAVAIEPHSEAPVTPVVIAASARTLMVLPENCTLRDALSMKTELLNIRDAADVVTIDIGAVKRIETANLQVLAAFVRDRRNADLPVTWSGVSEAVTQAVHLLGLDALLGSGAMAPRVAA
jgi:anti-anti-sigma regulatory factor